MDLVEEPLKLPGPTVQLDALQEDGRARDPAVVTPGAGGGDMTGETGAGKGGREVTNGLGAATAQAERCETGVPVAVQNGVVDPTGPGKSLPTDAASLPPDVEESSSSHTAALASNAQAQSGSNGSGVTTESTGATPSSSEQPALSISTAHATNGTTGSPPLSPLTPVPDSSDEDDSEKVSKGKSRAHPASPTPPSTKRRRTRSPPPSTLPLPPPPPPFLANGTKTQDDAPLGANYRVWTEQEDAYLLTLRASGYTFDQAAELLGRTSTAVSIRYYALKRRQKEQEAAMAAQAAKEERDAAEVSQLLLAATAGGFGATSSSVWTIDGQPVVVGLSSGFGDAQPFASTSAILPPPPAPSTSAQPAPPPIPQVPPRKASSIRHYTPEEDDLVCQYRQEGFSAPAISKKLNRSVNSIYNRLTALASMGRDVKPRKKTKAKKDEADAA